MSQIHASSDETRSVAAPRRRSERTTCTVGQLTACLQEMELSDAQVVLTIAELVKSGRVKLVNARPRWLEAMGFSVEQH